MIINAFQRKRSTEIDQDILQQIVNIDILTPQVTNHIIVEKAPNNMEYFILLFTST